LSWTDDRCAVLSFRSDALLRAHGCSQSTPDEAEAEAGLWKARSLEVALRQIRSNDHVRLEPLLAEKRGGEEREQSFTSKRRQVGFQCLSFQDFSISSRQ
jgi:hypothetical protein